MQVDKTSYTIFAVFIDELFSVRRQLNVPAVFFTNEMSYSVCLMFLAESAARLQQRLNDVGQFCFIQKHFRLCLI